MSRIGKTVLLFVASAGFIHSASSYVEEGNRGHAMSAESFIDGVCGKCKAIGDRCFVGEEEGEEEEPEAAGPTTSKATDVPLGPRTVEETEADATTMPATTVVTTIETAAVTTEEAATAAISTIAAIGEEEEEICLTVDGGRCVSGPWVWETVPGFTSWWKNCVPMTGEGRNLYDNKGILFESPGFKYMCPVRLGPGDKVRANIRGHHRAFRECVLDNPACLTNRTLNQIHSPKQTGCLTKSGTACVPEIWQDELGRWFQTCKRFGRLGSRKVHWKCATLTNNQGLEVEIEECSTEGQDRCLHSDKKMKTEKGRPKYEMVSPDE